MAAPSTVGVSSQVWIVGARGDWAAEAADVLTAQQCSVGLAADPSELRAASALVLLDAREAPAQALAALQQNPAVAGAEVILLLCEPPTRDLLEQLADAHADYLLWPATSADLAARAALHLRRGAIRRASRQDQAYGMQERALGASPEVPGVSASRNTRASFGEDDLWATSRFLAATGRVARVGGWTIDCTTWTPTISDELARLLELTPGMPLDLAAMLAFYAPEAQPLIQAAAQAAITEGRSWELELPLTTVGGRRLWVSTQGQAEYHDGRIVRLYGAMQDVTRRKEAELRLERQLRVEEALARASRELLAPVTSMADFRLVATAALECLRSALGVDQAYLTQVVHDPDDPYMTVIALATVPITITVDDHPLAQRFPLALFPRARRAELESGQIIFGPPDRSEMETAAQHAWLDQEQAQKRISIPVRLDGKFWGVLGFSSFSRRDWDELELSVLSTAVEMFGHLVRRWMLETELRQSEEQFRTAVETMLDGFAIFDSVHDAHGAIVDFRYRYINEVGCRLNQRTREEQIGRTLLELLPAHQGTELFADYVRLVETGVPVARESLIYEDQYGSGERLMRVFDVRAARLGDGFAVIWRDVTDRRLAHESLTQANEDLLRRVNDLRTLNQIAQTLAFTHDLPASLRSVCAAVIARTGAVSAAIVRFAGSRPASGSDADGQPVDDQLAGVMTLAPHTLGVLADPLLVQRRPIALTRHTPDFPLSDRVLDRLQVAEAAHVLLVPLTAPTGNLGLLVLGRGVRQAPFSVDEQSLVETIAGQIATAIANAQLAAQAQQAARLAERNRVARDLHDSATQALYSLVLFTGGWANQAEHGRLEDVAAKLRQLGDIALQVLKELRLLIYELRHPELVEAGLVRALEERLAAVEQRASVRTSLTVTGELAPLPQQVEEHVYTLLQEALNNALRHARAHAVAVRIRAERAQLVFAVQDDGVGFDPAGLSSGLGLRSMRERAAAIGARLSLTSAPGQGALVEISVPVHAT